MSSDLMRSGSIDEYIDGVLSGEVIACQAVKDACQRHLDDLQRVGQDGFPYVFDSTLADRACGLIECLELSTGEWAGKRFTLEPWQVFIVRSIFGWVHAETRFRRFRTAYLSVARGNGKSPLAAAIVFVLFAFDEPLEERAECYAIATKRDQAKIVFSECQRFVERSPFLRSRIQSYKHALTIESNHSTLQPIPAESKTADGLIPHAIALDEMHAMKEEHRELLEKLDTAMHKRRQPLMVIVTTAGNERSSVWRERYLLYKQVVSRQTTVEIDSVFAFIAEIDEEDDPFDEACWVKANPMLGKVVRLEQLQAERDKAQLNPVLRVSFCRYHCNRYTTTSDKPITPELWGRGAGELPDLNGAECRAGFDWGWRNDLAALALCFPLDNVNVNGKFKRRYAFKVWAWCPVQGSRQLNREPWASWVLARHLIATRGSTTDTDAVYRTLDELRDTYWIKSLALDGSNARELGVKLINSGMDVYEFPQSTKKYHEPTIEFVQALAEGRILHGDNPLLAWTASNLILEHDTSGYCKPDKKYSEEKIDPIVACIMALSECMFNAEPEPADGDDAAYLI